MVLSTRAMVGCVALLFVSPVQAKSESVYMGMTAQELTVFAKSEGLQAQVDRSSERVVTIQLNEQAIRIEQTIRIEMFDCDEKRRCMSGIIRHRSYYNVPPRYGVWHWNLRTLGATGFGPSYVTLQRYLHFRGVTDEYLREVIGKIWPKAAKSFWAAVRRRHAPNGEGAKINDKK